VAGSRAVSWHPVLSDGVLALLLLLTSVRWFFHQDQAIVLVALALTLPLVLRRSFPVTVFGLVSLSAFIQWLLAIPIWPVDIAVLVALYTVGTRASRWMADAALAVCLVGVGLAWSSAPARHHAGLLGFLAPAVLVIAISVVGRNMRTRRRYLQELEERAVRLERERHALARAAVAEERARIAREMHDVVAHTVSVMVAQADGAGVAVRDAPDKAEAALDVIADAGREALAELRRLLGVLREGAENGTAPQPGLADVETLLASVRASGLPVRYVQQGLVVGELEPTLALAAYRIVQESLTNTLKHAGPSTPTEVRFRHSPQSVEVEIVDQGTAAEGTPVKDGGHGLSGMRERVALFAGQLTAGPTPTGGWRVHAVLPIRGRG
jgi:signal transduction histidine kinase